MDDSFLLIFLVLCAILIAYLLERTLTEFLSGDIDLGLNESPLSCKKQGHDWQSSDSGSTKCTRCDKGPSEL